MSQALSNLPLIRLRDVIIALVAGSALLVQTACDRPFVPPAAPNIEVLSPSFVDVFASPRIELVLSASSFRDMDRVELNGAPMAYDAISQVWIDSVRLAVGLNRIVVEAFDVEQVSRRDTLDAVYLPLRVSASGLPDWSAPRGGHAASLLEDGRVLLTGGAPATDQPATDDAFLLDPRLGTIRRLEQGLRVPRAGHMTVRLTDGRILILGGSRFDVDRAEELGLDGLVADVELFDPAGESFTVIPFSGVSPIRRTGGTALAARLAELADDETVVLLFGGLGDIRYGATPRWGIRRDLRSFLFRSDTLEAWGAATGTPVEPMYGHTQTPLETDPETGLGRYLYAGAYIPPYATHPSDVDNRVFVLRFSDSHGTSRQEAGGLLTPRRRHAAERLSYDLVVFSGGLRYGPDPFLATMEVFSDAAFRMFGVRESVHLLRERWGHTATILSDQRILLIGGFGSDGRAVAAIERIESPFASD